MTQRLRVAIVVALAVGGLSAPAVWASVPTRALVFYGKATHVQFVNHADDRARGNATNPFGIDAGVPPPPTANSAHKGARAGDQLIVSLDLYPDGALTKSIGTAVYSCTFNFAEQATCDADFEFKNGSMFATGPADFVTGQFTLAVIGGTGAYLGSRGEFSNVATGKNTSRIDFLLVRSPG
jgi:hypothetical protein